MKKNCKTCRYSFSENDILVCNFPLIPEMFPDGIIDENPSNMSNEGINCNRYESNAVGFQKTVEEYKENLKEILQNDEKINCKIIEL